MITIQDWDTNNEIEHSSNYNDKEECIKEYQQMVQGKYKNKEFILT